MIGVGMIALAIAWAYRGWCWRAEKRAVRAHETAHLARADDTMKRAHAMMAELVKIRSTHTETPAPPFPAEGDNFATLPDASVLRPEFGKKPRTDTQPDGAA